MSVDRRLFCAASLMAAFGSQPAAFGSQVAALGAQTGEAAEKRLNSFAEPFAAMKVQDHGTSTFRAICDGMTVAGARVEVHETTLNPGAEPHPAHRHKHEEFLLMLKGEVEVMIDGKSTVLGPGSCGFWKSMSLHHARNVGQDVAQYFIVSVGTDA